MSKQKTNPKWGLIHLQHDSNSWSKNNKTAKQSFRFSKEIKYSVLKEFLNILIWSFWIFKENTHDSSEACTYTTQNKAENVFKF